MNDAPSDFAPPEPPCALGPLTTEASLELYGQGAILGLGFAPGELLAALWTRLSPAALRMSRDVVFSARTPNGLKVPMALEELGLDYELRLLDLEAGEQHDPAFLAINPNGRIPALLDAGMAVFESGAILLHLAEREQRLLPDTAPERAAALSWLFLQVAGLGPAFGQAGWFARQTRPQPLALERFRSEARRLAGVVESRLEQSTWLAGADYSIADIAHYGWLRALDYAGLREPSFPAIGRWRQAIDQRPATRRAMARMGYPPPLTGAG